MLKRMVIAFAVVLLSLVWSAGPSDAGVNVNINIGVPPLVISAPPAMMVIPGTYVYFAPDVDVDLIFYQGFWYRPYGGHWYRSADYNGGWVIVNIIPAPIRNLPPRWRQVPPGHARMPYRHVHDNWQAWERERHWDRDGRGGKRYDDDHGRRDRKDKRSKRGKRRNGDDDRDDDRYDRRGGHR